MNPYSMSALADERVHDLHVAAARYRLSVLARCCQPSTWLRALSRARATRQAFADWASRGQLGPARNYCACP